MFAQVSRMREYGEWKHSSSNNCLLLTYERCYKTLFLLSASNKEKKYFSYFFEIEANKCNINNK